MSKTQRKESSGEKAGRETLTESHKSHSAGGEIVFNKGLQLRGEDREGEG